MREKDLHFGFAAALLAVPPLVEHAARSRERCLRNIWRSAARDMQGKCEEKEGTVKNI
jgi:hypothetical protein